MYLPLVATESGHVNFIVPEGSILESGSIVATFQLDDPSKIRTAEIFEGELPEMKVPRVKGAFTKNITKDLIMMQETKLISDFERASHLLEPYLVDISITI
jgi:hypothetical protein